MSTSDKLWKTIATGAKVWEALEPVRTAAGTLDEALRRATRAIEGDLIHSDNEQINQIWAVGRVWRQELARYSRKDENYWLEVSGANLFSGEETGRAFDSLLKTKKHLEALREACEGMQGLIIAVSIADHMDIKGIASSLVSTKVLDLEARKEAHREFGACSKMIAEILPHVVRAMETVADMKNTIQKFHLLQESDNKARTEAAFRQAASNAGQQVGYGNIKVLSNSHLKRMGVDPEAFKASQVGREGRRYNIAVDKSTRDVYLVPVQRNSSDKPLPTGVREDQLPLEAPLRRQ